MNGPPEFLWYVTEVLLPGLKTKIGCPPPPPTILIQKKKKRSPAAPPRLPCDSPERTSVAAPDLCPRPPALRPIYSSLSLPTPKSQPAPSPPPRPLLWSAKVLLRRWQRRDRQRDWRLQSRVRSTSSHGRHMKGCFPERELNGRDPSQRPVLFKKKKSFCSVLLFLINTPKKNPTCLQHLFLFPQSLVLQRLDPRCRNFAVAQCQRLAGGRKRGGRKHRLSGLNCSSGHPAFRSGSACSLTSRQAVYLRAGTCSSARRGSRVPLPLGRAQRYRVPQIFDPRAHWEGGWGGWGAPDGFRACVVIHLTPAAAPEIRPAGDRRASGGRSPGKSLFIPPHTKTGLLKLTHNKCFLSGGQGWNYRDVPHCLRSVRLIVPSCLCLFSRLLPFLCKNKTFFLFHTACKPGYFKASESTKFCQVCPRNTKTSAAGATECQCEDGFFRSPSDPPTSACSGTGPAQIHLQFSRVFSFFESC